MYGVVGVGPHQGFYIGEGFTQTEQRNQKIKMIKVFSLFLNIYINL